MNMSLERDEGITIELEDDVIIYRNSFRALVKACRVAADDAIFPERKMQAIAEIVTGRKYPPKKSQAIASAYIERYFPESKGGAKVMDFEKDAEAIYSAFVQAYGINLHRDELTAGEFLCLLRNIPEETRMAETIHIRTMELPKDPQARAKVARAKRAVSLGDESNGFDNFAKSVENMAKRK